LITRNPDKTKLVGALPSSAKSIQFQGASSTIQFGGGKPKFGRKKAPTKFGDSFKVGLDDIEDEGNAMASEPSKASSGTAADGHREFINLSSGARTGMAGGYREEHKDTLARPAAVKPTFRGKLNLTKMGGGGNNEEKNEGVVKTYDFGVTFKSAYEPKEQRGEGGMTEGRGGRRPGGHRGARKPFGVEDDQEDEGFEIVRNTKEKKKRVADDSSSEEEPAFNSRMRGGARVEHRAARGGRGGMFSNEPDL